MKPKHFSPSSTQDASVPSPTDDPVAVSDGLSAESSAVCKTRRMSKTAWMAICPILAAALIAGYILFPRSPDPRKRPWDCPYQAAPTYTITNPNTLPFVISREIIAQLPIAPGVSPNPPSAEHAVVQISESPPVIDHPFLDDIRYVNGRFYACVVTGYDPKYTHSDCGAYHAEDAWVKVWYEVDVPNGRLASSPEDTEPGNYSSYYIFDEGCYSHQGSVYNGYYIESALDEAVVPLCRYDAASGKNEFIFTDREYHSGSVQAASDSYVVYHALRRGNTEQDVEHSYRVVDLKKRAVVFTLADEIDGQDIVPLFLYENKIFYQHHLRSGHGFSIAAIDIASGQVVHQQPDVFEPYLEAMSQKGDIAMLEAGNILSVANLAQDGLFVPLELATESDGYERAWLQPGAISEREILFTAGYRQEEADDASRKSILYRYSMETSELSKVWETQDSTKKLLYAGGLCLALTSGGLRCVCY